MDNDELVAAMAYGRDASDGRFFETRYQGFLAGAQHRAAHPHPTELPGAVARPVCDRLNPCPDRPTLFLGRFRERPWRCPQCSRWWVTRPDPSCYPPRYRWVRAETKAPPQPKAPQTSEPKPYRPQPTSKDVGK